MKRIIFYAMAVLCVATVMSCGEKKDYKDVRLKPDAQKKFLNDVALEFTENVSASDFNDLDIFVRDLIDIYRDYSWSSLENNVRSSFDGSKDRIDAYDETVYSSSYWQEVYHYDVYEVSLILSNFTGHYSADSRGSWRYTPAQDLQFTFKDLERKECVLTLTKEGSETKLRIPSFRSHVGYDYYYDYQSERYLSTDYFERLNFILSVPKNITLSLTRAGKNVVTAKIRLGINDLTRKDYFDFGKSYLNSSVEIVLNNGYKTSWNGEYTANDKLSVNGSVSKSNDELISCVTTCDPSGFPSIIYSDSFDEDELIELKVDDDVNIENLYVSASILNKAQIIGKVVDARSVKNLVEKLDKNRTSERRFKEYLKQINEKLDIGLYYNGSNKRQAYLQLEAFCESYYRYGYYEERWDFEPVMVFSDDTRISCEVFFDKDYFRKALDAFEEMEEDFEDLID